MHENLAIIHRNGVTPWSLTAAEESHWLLWQTCMRSLLFGRTAHLRELDLKADDQIYQGEAAYQFALEVVAGLHSPIIGETEVHGQFKQLLEGYKKACRTKDAMVLAALKNINIDARLIRHRHLRAVGSQSYGSAVRRLVRPYGDVHFVGAGLFVKELLPWIVKLKKNITIHARNPEKARSIIENRAEISLKNLNSNSPVNGVMVIAAPLSAQQIHQWFQRRMDEVRLVIDLRGTSSRDPLMTLSPQVNLADLFQQIERTRENAEKHVRRAKTLISQLAMKRMNTAVIRPFGWDDLCA